jgi:hypothetical protein
LLADTLSLGDGLIGMEHTEWYHDSFSRGKTFHIPELSQPPGLVPKTGFHLGK